MAGNCAALRKPVHPMAKPVNPGRKTFTVTSVMVPGADVWPGDIVESVSGPYIATTHRDGAFITGHLSGAGIYLRKVRVSQ